MTMADKIARLFNDDGECWEIEIPSGKTLDLEDLLVERANGREGWVYLFEDGSGIVALDSKWCTLEDFIARGGRF